MFLLLSITAISFLIAFIHIITKPVSFYSIFQHYSRFSSEVTHFFSFPLQVVALLSSASSEETQLNDEINALKEELESMSMRQEYTAYVKIERKIVTAQAKLNETRQSSQTKKIMFQYGVPYGSQAFLSLVLLVITIAYRYTPIVIFEGSQYDLIPFGAIIRFPTGVDGAVSVPFWIFVNNYVSRHVASYVK